MKTVDRLVRTIIMLYSEAGELPSKKAIADRAYADDESLRERFSEPRSQMFTEEQWAAAYARIAITEAPELPPLDELRRTLKVKAIHVAASEAEIPKVAAQTFCRIVQEGSTVAFSCGLTLLRMIRELAGWWDEAKPLTAVAAVVLLSDEITALPPVAVPTEFLHFHPRATVQSYLLPIGIDTLMSGDPSERRRKLREFLKRSVFDNVGRADSFWFGIGSLGGASSFPAHAAQMGALQPLRDHGAIGECAMWPYDGDGRLIYDKLGLSRTSPGQKQAWSRIEGTPLGHFFNRTFTIQWDHIGQNTQTVAVCGGRDKHEAIYTALCRLRPRLRIDRLITDRGTLVYLNQRIASSSAQGRSRVERSYE